MSDHHPGLVLVVDDDNDIREIIELTLSAYGYRVQTLKNGQECLERLRKGDAPALVLLDLMMPEMNGWTVCDELAKEERLSRIPVVVLTGNAEVEGDHIGHALIMKKPLELETLLSTVERYAG